MPANTEAWLVEKQGRLEVEEAPYTPPREDEIVVRNHAVAINPVDWINQGAAGLVCPWMKFPFVLGSDLAGEVVQVGSGITRFRWATGFWATHSVWIRSEIAWQREPFSNTRCC